MKKIKEIIKKIYYGMLKKKIKNEEFTIISNNCFGGIIYKNFNIKYRTPTCGTFFMAEDYIKFIYNLKEYLDAEVEEISIENSKYCEYLKKIKYDKPIGKIKDIEVFFMHYDTFDEAFEKWNRRKKRVVWNNIIYKFNDQNLCGYKHLKLFNDFQANKKILFTAKKYEDFNTIQLKKYENYEYVLSDVNYRDYKNVINIFEIINS